MRFSGGHARAKSRSSPDACHFPASGANVLDGALPLTICGSHAQRKAQQNFR